MQDIKTSQKEYRAVGLVLFFVAIGLLSTRIFANLIASKVSSDMLDIIFTLISQSLCFIIPFLVYKFMLKKKTREVFTFSNYHKVDVRILLLSILLGICGLFVTMMISSSWASLLIALGYNYPMPDPLPAVFHPWQLVVDLLLVGVLPAICEEFCNRGGTITVFNRCFGKTRTVIYVGIIFGLFHQNITQVFYTCLCGMLWCYLTMEFNSIFPAMIMHFTNNSLSVYLDYASNYNLWGGAAYNSLMNNNVLLYVVILSCALIGVAIFFLMKYINTKNLEKQGKVKVFTPKILMGRTIKVKQPYEHFKNDFLYVSTLGDNAFLIGAFTISVLSTIFSFIWGL